MFYLAVVLESGDVVGGGLDAQDEAEFVVNLNRGFAETMLDAGALDPGCELTADLLGELEGDLVAQEGGHVFGFDGQDGLPGKLFIERFEDGLRAEHQIGGVFDLHEAPVVGRSEEVEYRTALRGIAVEDLMQSDGREVVGQCLRPLPVVDAQKGVVGKLEADPGGSELASQPAMSVAIELETERTPGGNAQIDQAQFGVDKVDGLAVRSKTCPPPRKMVKTVAVARSEEHVFNLRGGRVNKLGKPIEAPGNSYTLNPTGQPHSAMIATENIALLIYSGETDDVKSVEIVDIEPPLEEVA